MRALCASCLSRLEERTLGTARRANKYGSRKDKDYNAIISAKNLDLHYQSVTFGTFGSFGTGT